MQHIGLYDSALHCGALCYVAPHCLAPHNITCHHTAAGGGWGSFRFMADWETPKCGGRGEGSALWYAACERRAYRVGENRSQVKMAPAPWERWTRNPKLWTINPGATAASGPSLPLGQGR